MRYVRRGSFSSLLPTSSPPPRTIYILIFFKLILVRLYVVRGKHIGLFRSIITEWERDDRTSNSHAGIGKTIIESSPNLSQGRIGVCREVPARNARTVINVTRTTYARSISE